MAFSPSWATGQSETGLYHTTSCRSPCEAGRGTDVRRPTTEGEARETNFERRHVDGIADDVVHRCRRRLELPRHQPGQQRLHRQRAQHELSVRSADASSAALVSWATGSGAGARRTQRARARMRECLGISRAQQPVTGRTEDARARASIMAAQSVTREFCARRKGQEKNARD